MVERITNWVAKNAPNREAGMRYIAFCLRPDRQAAFGEAIFYTPNARQAFALVSPEAKAFMPDMESPDNAVADAAWQIAGANAIFASGPFERRLRDIRTVMQQAQGRKSHLQDAGAFLLGLEPNFAYA